MASGRVTLTVECGSVVMNGLPAIGCGKRAVAGDIDHVLLREIAMAPDERDGADLNRIGERRSKSSAA